MGSESHLLAAALPILKAGDGASARRFVLCASSATIATARPPTPLLLLFFQGDPQQLEWIQRFSEGEEERVRFFQRGREFESVKTAHTVWLFGKGRRGQVRPDTIHPPAHACAYSRKQYTASEKQRLATFESNNYLPQNSALYR